MLIAITLALTTTMTGVSAWTPTAQAASAAAAAAEAFSDVSKGHWAYGAVNQLAKSGYITGYGDGTFQGDRPLSRYEFALAVTRALDKYDKADQNSKILMDKLSVEFSKELNTLGTRIAKVEAKTKNWVTGDARVRYFNDSPNKAIKNAKGLSGADQFDYRVRIGFKGDINDKTSFWVRYNTGNTSPGTSDTGLDSKIEVAAFTVKDTLGMDKIVVGRSALNSIGYGMIGKPGNTDGLWIDKKIGDVKFNAFSGNLKVDGAGNSLSSKDPQQITTAQLGFKVTDRLNFQTGYYWADIKGGNNTGAAGTNTNINTNVGSYSSSSGLVSGLNYQMGKYDIMGEFITTKLDNAVNLPNNPKGWTIALTHGRDNAKVFYGPVGIVNPKKPHTNGWMVSYKSIDPGTVPANAGGFDTQAASYKNYAYNSFNHGTDNVKGFEITYQNVLALNTVLSLDYQNLKIKNRSLTNLPSDDMTKVFSAKVEFFF